MRLNGTAVLKWNVTELGCFEITHPKKCNSGYVNIKKEGRSTRAHRAVWEESTGEKIPSGLVVMHTCDNRACVNMDHLRLGTVAENNKDKSNKGRWRGPKQDGILNHMAKFTEEEVLEIVSFRGKKSQDDVAKMFSISQTTVWRLWNKTGWKHLNYKKETYAYCKTKGEKVHTAKITPEQALKIYRSEESYSELSKKYGINESSIGAVKTGRTWKHVTQNLGGST